jgi:hypothetical protein
MAKQCSVIIARDIAELPGSNRLLRYRYIPSRGCVRCQSYVDVHEASESHLKIVTTCID